MDNFTLILLYFIENGDIEEIFLLFFLLERHDEEYLEQFNQPRTICQYLLNIVDNLTSQTCQANTMVYKQESISSVYSVFSHQFNLVNNVPAGS